MIDADTYKVILNAAFDILKNNGNNLGREFMEGFMASHDPNNGSAAQRNASNLADFVVDQARRRNNGANEVRDRQQLFDIVGSYIEGCFSDYSRQRQGQGFGFNSRPAPMSFGGGSTIGGGSSGGGLFGGSRGTSGFGQPSTPGPSSHLADQPADPITPVNRPASAQPASSSVFTFDTPSSGNGTGVVFSDNPLDTFPESGIEFNRVPTNVIWGDEKPLDRRIVLVSRDTLKTRDDRFSVGAFGAFHQLILNDPMDVVRDFFKVVPDSTLAAPFLFRISYNHLDVIDVPTSDFIEIRNKCVESIANDTQIVLHRKILELLDTMQRGPWKAMTTYLTAHVNRALHLACRLSSDPKLYIKIGDFEDLNELLSSSFQHPFVVHPEGRLQLETIVGMAILNAITLNSNAMFESKTLIPTNAMLSSPAFPFSMEGVYPSKYAIPESDGPMAETFMRKLQDHELAHRSYILSRRSVVITNILGRNVLPKIGKEPSMINSPVGALLNQCIIPYTRLNADKNVYPQAVAPNVSEEHPSDQLENYYEDQNGNEEAEVEVFSRKKSATFPVDQTIFAIQYGGNPKDYLLPIDVFSTIDDKLGQGQVILAKKNVPVIKPTA